MGANESQNKSVRANEGNEGNNESWNMNNAERYTQMVALLQGRSLFPEEVVSMLEHAGWIDAAEVWQAYVQRAVSLGDVRLVSGIEVERLRKLWRSVSIHRCQRCGSTGAQIVVSYCARCGKDCAYCEACLAMGRSRSCTLLVQGVTAEAALLLDSAEVSLEPWQLSPAQQAASRAGIAFLRKSNAKGFLIWAVTGAGKTEMIFPFIEYVVHAGGRVCIATPRRDVVLELQPRLAKAFSGHTVVTLYGGSPERWNSGPIVLATTHQLIRFQAAFDLVVIDELDAFPFHNNPLLAYTARKACKASGKFIYLSATPPLYLERLVNKKQMPFVKVPVRYHRHPLPVPKHIGISDLQPLLIKQSFPRKLQAALTQSVRRGAQVFVFVTKIKYVEDTVKLLRSIFTDLVVAGTSSHDPERAEKVQRFRAGDIRLLVTTTILERGVTVPKTDVFILGAESTLFDSAALVQMSGRAGRSKDDPYGFVYFCAKDRTRAQKKAIHQIVSMNRIARKQGYLIGR